MANVKHIDGMRFGKLVAVSPTAKRENGKIVWYCDCDCGNFVAVNTARLISGRKRNCGCVKPEGSRTIHGHCRIGSRSPEYKIWMSMRKRCNNPNDAAFPDYGGRGISVCARWDNFENFLADMGPRPTGLTLDRYPNKNGNYEPSNCRWATWIEQQRNRRSNRIFTVDGVTASLAEHCERRGCKYKTAHRRLTCGASIELALSQTRPTYGSIKNAALAVTIERLLGPSR